MRMMRTKQKKDVPKIKPMDSKQRSAKYRLKKAKEKEALKERNRTLQKHKAHLEKLTFDTTAERNAIEVICQRQRQLLGHRQFPELGHRDENDYINNAIEFLNITDKLDSEYHIDVLMEQAKATVAWMNRETPDTATCKNLIKDYEKIVMRDLDQCSDSNEESEE